MNRIRNIANTPCAGSEERVSAHAQEKVESVPVTESNSGQLGNWMPLDVLDARVKEGPLPTVCLLGDAMILVFFSVMFEVICFIK